MENFFLRDPNVETQWRSLILFGKNSATYKFAFANVLLDLVDQEMTEVTLEQISKPYADYILDHLSRHDKQGNSNSSEFLNACRSKLRGEMSEGELLEVTRKKGFVNVVDAFQNLSGGTIENKFYEKDYDRQSKRLVFTDNLLALKERYQYQNLKEENEARWSLVETAWNLKLSPHLIELQHDNLNNKLFMETDFMRRIDVTSAKDALNGYQKGKCFYCRRNISIESGSEDICHVDHFLPHTQKRQHYPANINGVWNLVLACGKCNGTAEKGARIPDKVFLAQLHTRNDRYISSNHPLAETIVNQTGLLPKDRSNFLRRHYQLAYDLNPVATWRPKEVFPSVL